MNKLEHWKIVYKNDKPIHVELLHVYMDEELYRVGDTLIAWVKAYDLQDALIKGRIMINTRGAQNEQ